ncbi:MAG: hypothetical protein O6826_00560 [Acidobacteria bacterium]|nr:hypothetical protein [Acidobacteriota bacterium]
MQHSFESLRKSPPFPTMPLVQRGLMKDESGVSLLIVTIVSILMALLGMSMIFDSMTEVTISNELENQKKARLNAETGFSTVKDALRQANLTAVLQSTTGVPRYMNYPLPSVGTVAEDYFLRNPIAPQEAMNIDFEDPPTRLTTRTVNGFLTPGEGTPLAAGGRYWAKITDNDDGDGDLTTDVDGIVYLRTIGIQRIGAGQITTYGGTVKNSVGIIQSTLKRDQTLAAKAPFTIYGPNAVPSSGGNLFAGAAFEIDGYDHPTMTLADLLAGNDVHTTDADGDGLPDDSAGIDAVFDNPGGGDGTPLRDTIHSDMNGGQMGNLVGNQSDYGGTPSLRDGTDRVRNDPNPDATNIFNATYLMNFINKTAAVADVTLAHGTNFSGSNLGTDAAPQITYCEGDCRLGGSSSGAGLLIVRGQLTFQAAFAYHGLILVVGEGDFDMSGSNVGILGGLLVANTIDNGDGTWSYGIPAFTVAGNSNFYYQEGGIGLGFGLLPIRKLSWREVYPEIEPPF